MEGSLFMNTIMMPMCFHKVVKFKSIGWDFTVLFLYFSSWLLFLQANSRINMVLHGRQLGSCFHVSNLMKLLALLLFWQAHLVLQMSKLYHGDKYWYRSQRHSYVIVHKAKVMAFGQILISIDEGILGVFDLYLCAWEMTWSIWKSKVSIEERRILLFLFSLFCYISDANLYSPFCFPMLFLSLPWQECSNIIPLISLLLWCILTVQSYPILFFHVQNRVFVSWLFNSFPMLKCSCLC